MQSITLRNEKSESQTQAGPDSHILKTVTYQFISSRNLKAGGVLQCWFCPSLLWGLHPAGELTRRKSGMKWRGSGADEQNWEGHYPILSLVSSEVHSSPNQPKCRVTMMPLHCLQNSSPSPWFALFLISWRAQPCSLVCQPQEHLSMPGCSENLSYSAGTDLGTMGRNAR